MKQFIIILIACILFSGCGSTSDESSTDQNNTTPPGQDNTTDPDAALQYPKLLIGPSDVSTLAAKLGDAHLQGSVFARHWIKVDELDFSSVVTDSAALVADLDANGYVDDEDEISQAFIMLGDATELNLPDQYTQLQKSAIYDIMLDALYQRDNKVHSALECLLRGIRSETAIRFLMEYVAHVEQTGLYTDPDNGFEFDPGYPLIADYQWRYMTLSEQERTREVLLSASQDIYDRASVETPPWYFREEHINNWFTANMTDYSCQRMLYPALMFPDDPRSEPSRNRAIELLRAWWDSMPNHEEGGDTIIEMIDETLTSPNGYGIWDLNEFVYLALTLLRNSNFNPFDYGGGFMESEGIYRTYILSFMEGIRYNSGAMASYVGAGHGSFSFIAPYSNIHFLQLAAVYNNPVLAWHYYANPSQAPTDNGNPVDMLSQWNAAKPPVGWKNIIHLLYWGEVAPTSPQDAGWPLTAYFPGAGAAIIRKSWEKSDGLIWIRGGYGGSHYQPSQATVIYHADDTVILGNGGSQNYSPDSRMNNVLLVDGQGQISPYPGLPAQRQSYAAMTQVGDDTYFIDASAAYAELDCGLNWTRRVHYDRTADVLEIIDRVSTTDGQSHDLRFNWVTEATVQDSNTYSLPGGYTMAAQSDNVLAAETVTVTPYTEETQFQTLQVSTQGEYAVITWTISKE